MKKIFILATATFALLTAGTAVAADMQDDTWKFGITVPFWAVGIDGDVTIGGVEQDVDIGFDDLTDNLDASFSIGLEARKGKFGFYTGVGYMAFSADGRTAGGGNFDAELNFLIADAGVSYLLVHTHNERPFILEGTLGIRYWGIDTDLEVNGGVVGSFDDGDTRDLIDPMIGLRGSKYLTEKLHLDFAGDIGGFGVSDESSDLGWSATGLLSYDFVDWFTLSAGYKAVSVDAEEGSNADKNGVDLLFSGAVISAKFTF